MSFVKTTDKISKKIAVSRHKVTTAGRIKGLNYTVKIQNFLLISKMLSLCR